ncbi:MAG: 50S ribosomal protein L29 [Candidatus Brocadia sp. AMX2]|uniref:Large ribosomal subunit protein uL29 n=1 Tax=Candidatus Brocadia sinica JPN1 TaxID=1197129 RepID=A0ABQ0JYW9_9BACT|nr:MULTISPECIES: 50S ribosomal protein L29 [Brocadia]KXK26356.1 MAG: 50S ribosomal protein L29 [Candidatus Brocadia sinica]MBC6932928.1 50S ribosomal protein L29 [Candidatus Brocadia sp.]MBL1167586.1 50S ribosomal protein L29 [Candidatus Brocadia sp. AMX1]NOG40524.1 50S ribosomal protein L29 [Planctomycetota bacterium]KAA0242049.1 MAG: 50S ribosomal protein L29 [Candidatus Brocadia sp. AMX2]
MKASEIRTKSRQEILDEIDASRRELLNICFQWQAGETRNPAQRKDIRRKIARLQTILKEIDLGIIKNSQSEGVENR